MNKILSSFDVCFCHFGKMESDTSRFILARRSKDLRAQDRTLSSPIPSPHSSGGDHYNPWTKYCCIYQRYIIYILTFFGILIADSLRNISIIAIVPIQRTENQTLFRNGTCPLDSETLSEARLYRYIAVQAWSEFEANILISVYYLGFILMQVPAGYLADLYGGKHVLTVSLLGSSVVVASAPPWIVWSKYDFRRVLGWRIMSGLFQAGVWPSVFAILAQWTPNCNRATAICFVLASFALGSAVSRLLGRYLMNLTRQWQTIYYVFGALGMFWCLVWQIFGYSYPYTNPFITHEEQVLLKEDLDEVITPGVKIVPWRRILTCRPFWGITIIWLGHTWGWYSLTQNLSIYLNITLKFNVFLDEYWGAIPFCFTGIVAMFFGVLSDWLIHEKHVSPTPLRKAVAGISQIGTGLFIIFASFFQCDRQMAILCFTIALASCGGIYAAPLVNLMELGPNFAGILIAIPNAIGAFGGLLAPVVVEALVPERTLTQWENVFLMNFFILASTAIVYVVLASSRLQQWNTPQ